MIRFIHKFCKYKDWSIRFKLLTISILLILGSVFLVSLLSYFQYTRNFEKQSADRIQQIIEQVSLNLDTYIDDLFRLSVSPYYNGTVMAALEDDVSGSEMEQLDKSRLIENFLDEMMIIPRKDILRVFALTTNVYAGSRIRTNIDSDIDFHKFPWYNEALKKHDPIFVPVHLEQIVKNPKYMVFSVVCQIRSTRNPDKVLGVVKVDANYTGIQSICDKVSMGKGGSLYIIDGNNNIIYSGNVSTPALDADGPELLSKLNETQKSYYTIKLSQNGYLVNTTRIPRSNWTIVSVNSLKDLNEEAVRTRNFAFFLAILCSLSAILVFTLFSRRFLQPLLAIVKLMKEVQRGNLTVKYRQKSSDEIGYLGSSFNIMVSKINDMIHQNTLLVKQVYEAKLLQKEAQFNALYSQIKPHFLYNALNMISLSMQCGKNEKAVENINNLSSLLRAMANVNREIPLETEISLLDSYLSIQSSRFEGRLAYSIDIDRNFYSYYIPSLLFQPIIENSVVHGCENKKGKTNIKVFNTVEDHVLTFHIQDDGNGIPEDKLLVLRKKLDGFEAGMEKQEAENKRSGIGLVNVNKRIKIKFGEKYGLHIDSTIGEGTFVKIILPVDPTKEAASDVQAFDH